MIVRPCGDRALIVDLDDVDDVLGLTTALRDDRPAGVVDVVPAARTVLVVLDGAGSVDDVRRTIERIRWSAPATAPTDDTIEVEVVYDGPDLTEVARLTGLSEIDVVAAHTGRPWRAAFVGFAPGFAYLDGGDERLAVPRRDEPRTRVPGGAVALAGGFSAVYPSASPGGWRLIGRTTTRFWDLDRDPPALVRPGQSVRFTAVDG